MARRVGLVLFAVAACGGRTAAPAAAPTAPTAPAVQPAPAAAPSGAGRSLYRRGQVHVPRTAGDDRETCWGRAGALAACQSMRPDGRCQLEPPVGYWEGSIYCRGAAMDAGDMTKADMMREGLTVPDCECSCAAAFIAARQAFSEKLAACSRVP